MKKTLTPIAAAFVVSIAATPLAAAENPFSVSDLTSGYSIALGDKPAEGKCGDSKKTEAKCGGDKKTEGKCGDSKKTEAKCGGDKKMEGKCGGK